MRDMARREAIENETQAYVTVTAKALDFIRPSSYSKQLRQLGGLVRQPNDATLRREQKAGLRRRQLEHQSTTSRCICVRAWAVSVVACDALAAMGLACAHRNSLRVCLPWPADAGHVDEALDRRQENEQTWIVFHDEKCTFYSINRL